jgi:hypothetical protein
MLKDNGRYLVCDHHVGQDGMQNEALYTTVEEQPSALLLAGFNTVTNVLQKGGLVLHAARTEPA